MVGLLRTPQPHTPGPVRGSLGTAQPQPGPCAAASFLSSGHSGGCRVWARTHASPRPATRRTGRSVRAGARPAVSRNTCLHARKRIRLARHAATYNRKVSTASQERPVTSAAATTPMYPSMRRWHVLWKRLPVPAPPPPSRRHVKHTLWQADDSMTQTYIQRGLRHVRCSLSTSLTL